MDIQAKRKWMIVGIILLLAVAIAVGTSDIWKMLVPVTGKRVCSGYSYRWTYLWRTGSRFYPEWRQWRYQ